jgi:hypothetical protein
MKSVYPHYSVPRHDADQCRLFSAGSEAESFSDMDEQCARKWSIKAQSAAIARAMASICNAERALSGVMSAHERKTLSL